ncbi:NAD(+) diphosphatase [Kaistia dalseonensis]|uniref:NAD(+) diphosphatase n=1 Tax=Kaistia dalseonensis TaxID=410840 RepID=A0ABU0H9F1_9HYPH|nr:NAD(+) diphosphatase [Kaistia dalseonensis]MCX5496334.1 NAD(+) diphosphatase [Kaistia dalseonensis]MDQ0438953.1 NAD+ diphosphatase [Kaistia dalseonensis]
MARSFLSSLPPVEASTLAAFSGNALDRRSEARNESTLAAALADPAARVFLLRGDEAMMRSHDASEALFTLKEAQSVGADMDDIILLGWDGSAPRLATTLTSETSFDVDAFQAVSIRTLAVNGSSGSILMNATDPGTLGALAQARALLHWHGSTRFCGRCATRTTMTQAGYRRDCPNCGALYFPRTDPVAIMLAIDGDKCLMGRQARFAAGTYSCLAGFIEPGETIENAVRREIQEEAGVKIGRVAYLASQPWPFPMSLMIGCHAEALSTEIVPDTEELEDCRWFSRDETMSMLNGEHPDGLATPPRMAIAHTLIRAWAEAG